MGFVQGALELRINSGLMQQSFDKGVTWNYVGVEAASLAWLGPIADFVASKDAALTNILFRSNCNTLMNEVEFGQPNTGVAGLARVAGSTNLRLRTSSSTTASSFAYLRNRSIAVNGAASTFGNLIANCRTSKFAVAVRGIVRAVNNTCQLIMCNMTDEASQDTYLGVTGATSQTNFTLKVGSAAAIDTGVAVGTLGTAEHDLIIVSDGTTVSAYIDLATTAVASGAANTGANAAGHTNSYAVNGATTTVVSHEILQWAVFGI